MYLPTGGRSFELIKSEKLSKNTFSIDIWIFKLIITHYFIRLQCIEILQILLTCK